jgi:hypothetical protein
MLIRPLPSCLTSSDRCVTRSMCVADHSRDESLSEALCGRRIHMPLISGTFGLCIAAVVVGGTIQSSGSVTNIACRSNEHGRVRVAELRYSLSLR